MFGECGICLCVEGATLEECAALKSVGSPFPMRSPKDEDAFEVLAEGDEKRFEEARNGDFSFVAAISRISATVSLLWLIGSASVHTNASAHMHACHAQATVCLCACAPPKSATRTRTVVTGTRPSRAHGGYMHTT